MHHYTPSPRTLDTMALVDTSPHPLAKDTGHNGTSASLNHEGRHQEPMTNLNQMSTNTCNTRHMAQILSYFIKNLGPKGESPTRSQDYHFMQHRKHHHLVLSYFIKKLRRQEPMTNLNQLSTNTCNTGHMAHILSYFIKNLGPKGESPTRSQDYHFVQHKSVIT